MKSVFRIAFPLALIILLAFSSCNQKDVAKIHIIPKPLRVWDNKGYFIFSDDTRILFDGESPASKEVAAYFVDKIAASTGMELSIEDVSKVKSISKDILLSMQGADSVLGDEGYSLQIRRNHVTLQANTARGLFYGVQTMLQLMPPGIERAGGLAISDLRMPCVMVWDKPAFRWRGMHLDVCRHFFPVDSVKKFIDLLALHKMNTFHWHLTEDQGWRIEIKKYPKLTEIGAWRENSDGNRYGGFYSQEDVREIVDYAAKRYITVVPEIEMPGHSLAALAAYPEYSCTGGPFKVTGKWGVFEDVYCAGKDETFEFLEDILDEVVELFPGKYIHIGGDECPKTRWKECNDCQRRIKNEGLADEHELQSYFIKRMEKYLNGKGRRIIGWDEILEGGLAPEATVMSWRGIQGGIEAAQQGHDVVMSPTSHCYFDYYQGDPAVEPKAIGGFTPLSKVYEFHPVPAELNEQEAKHILGGQANVWTEYIDNWRHLEYMVLPRMSALSEALWTSKKRKNYDAFLDRLGYLLERLDVMGYNYRIPEPVGLKKETILFNDTSVVIEPPFKQAEIWYSTSENDTSERKYSDPLSVNGDLEIRAWTVLPDGRRSVESKARFIKVNEDINGVLCSVYNGQFEKLPDFEELEADTSFKVYNISLDAIDHPANRFALCLETLLQVDKAGEYGFWLASDDGSRLQIDGKTIIDNDGLHGDRELNGRVFLESGLHNLVLTYFDSWGNESLALSWAVPGKQKELIHPENFIFPDINKFTQYVNPFIGTAGHGHTFPGATTPFGMVQLSPDTRKDSWDGCSGYHYSDGTIMGFSMTHLSGTGVGDYGDFRFMPMTGELMTEPGDEENPETGYRSRFSHEKEKASAGYYHVELEDYGITVDLTATTRAGLQKYTFSKPGHSWVLIDLKESITSDKILESEVRIINDRQIEGFRRTDGWADDQHLYFFAEFSKPFDSAAIVTGETISFSQDFAKGTELKAALMFTTHPGEEILVKTGISSVSADNARKNVRAEIPGFDFEHTRMLAMKSWNRELGRIEVESRSRADKVKFYTALYHCFIAPNIYSDVDGRFRGHDLQVHEGNGHPMYTVFSLWDTFRALHPLFTIIQQERTNELINAMLTIYRIGGLLPVWELAANETWCMIGYHSIPVIADAYAKGIRGYDAELALQAMQKSAMQDHHGLKYYRKHGYIPAGKDGESVSKTLEYAYDDWCIAEMGRWLGKEDVFEEYIQRAQYYKNIYDPTTGFMRGKINGQFVTPFDPTEVNFMLTEANTWQYNFFVPQDISGLIRLMGGEENFNSKLDQMFSEEKGLSGRHQSDITGLVGQYAHGNEPSHHMAYLYNYSGQPWKTQELVRKIMHELYTDQPDGLCGNEDCGQMSAWYVLSAMGFYPVVPGSTEYAMGSPEFEKVTINLENGKKFRIVADGNSMKNKYIQSASLNGSNHPASFITQDDIVNGGLLQLEMGSQPGKSWGTGKEDRPVSVIDEFLITPVPYVMADGRTFTDRMEVALGTILEGCTIYYTLDGSNPTESSIKYESPLTITENTTIKAFATKDGLSPSKAIEASFNRMPEGRSLEIRHPYSSQYTAGGDIALIDQLRGGDNFRTGFWQGYYGVDLEVILDLGKLQEVNSIGIGFLQDQGSWIFMPVEVSFYLSRDKKDFRLAGNIKNDVDERQGGGIIKEFTLREPGVETRFIKIIAKNRGVCPEWHVGDGNPAWIFADEILVE